ncbi:hypothetical protein SAY87_009630 [Trapa incisa]|uniref:CTLH domain-containing protein n=1 Tax=Trapa incisa TaxID=236973 RepID=A0AAN7K210_9MYRT|nr:hypothetical protein SAY87_009630 [Trapa incisa]
MSAPNKDLSYMVLQYLNEEGYSATARLFERESGCYFYMEYFEYAVMNGQWEAAEKYLSSFTKFDDNQFSLKVYFDMRKQHFLETLDSGDRAKALDILMKDLKVFAIYDDHLFNEMTQLLTITNIRENEKLAFYKDAFTQRGRMMTEIKTLIKRNPAFKGKLKYPSMEGQRLKNLVNQMVQPDAFSSS